MVKRLDALVHILIQVLLVGAFCIFVFKANWVSAFSTLGIFALLLLPSILHKYWNIFIPTGLDATLAVFVFVTLFLGEMRNFYAEFPMWDSILHFLSGIILTLLAFVIVYIFNGQSSRKLLLSPFFLSTFSFCFSLAISVLWEMFEFFMDVQFGRDMQHGGLPDTMIDLNYNAGSSFVVALVAYVWIRRNLMIPFTNKRIIDPTADETLTTNKN